MILQWDKVGEREYEIGVERVALYLEKAGAYPLGVAWNGVSAVNLSPSGAEATPIWANNNKYLNVISTEELGVSIEAYMSPEEFDVCDGAKKPAPGLKIKQQSRSVFGLAFMTKVGNDTEMDEHDEKLHLVYGCLAAPSEKAYSTITDSPEPIALSWEISTTPVAINTLVDGKKLKNTADMEIKKSDCLEGTWAKLLEIVYGTDTTEARLPLPDEVITLLTTPVAP